MKELQRMKNWQKSAKRRLFIDEERAKMGWKDWLIIAAVTLIYAVVAFTNLGSLDIPKTYYAMENSGEDITVELRQPETVESIRYYTSFGNGTFSFSYSLDGEGFTPVFLEKETGDYDEQGRPIKTLEPLKVDHDAIGMYEWQFKFPQSFYARYITIHVEKAGTRMLELGFCNDGVPVGIESVTKSGFEEQPGNPVRNMFDEQQYIPKQTYYMTEMYFDEVYHARTAYEEINHISPYEITHPPLGKTFLSMGIQVFGMDPFGWRLMGTFFGVMMLPLMYIFAKRLFKRPLFAFIPTFLFAVDFMHFSQTRIATIDSYSLFFVLLAYYFMYKYTETNYNREPLKRSLIPLALCGIAFGLGAATKWLCIYAGLGLAVILFIQIYKRWREFDYAALVLSNKEQSEAMDEPKRVYFADIMHGFTRKTIATLLWCVLFFIIVPAVIYLTAYLPYMGQAVNTFGYLQRGVYFGFFAVIAILLTIMKILDIRGLSKKEAPAKGADKIRRISNRKIVITIISCILIIAAIGAFIGYSGFVLYTDNGPQDIKASFDRIWGNQNYMFNYHWNLKTDKPHPFQSKWWSWPLDIRPVFLFQGEGYPPDQMSSLSTMGNPAVWWGALASVIALVVIRLHKGKFGKRTMFLGIAAASQYVPWLIISRETFIYHYFETVPFLILLTAVLAKYMIERTKHGEKWVISYLAVCLLLFIMFYPVTTGIVIPRDYASVIRWLPSWPFY
jgi:dolichyl-phosphate-mannose--protein O-mannosyl transferase